MIRLETIVLLGGENARNFFSETVSADKRGYHRKNFPKLVVPIKGGCHRQFFQKRLRAIKGDPYRLKTLKMVFSKSSVKSLLTYEFPGVKFVQDHQS